MVRTLLVVAVYSPLLMVNAAELFLLFVVQTWCAALSVRGLQACGVGSSSSPGDVTRRGYSIGAVLFATGLVAGGVAVWQITPAVNIEGWVSLVSCGWMLVGCVAGSWWLLHSKMRWYSRATVAMIATIIGATVPAMFDWLLVSFGTDTISWPPEFSAAVLWGYSVSRPIVSWYAVSFIVVIYLTACLLLFYVPSRVWGISRIAGVCLAVVAMLFPAGFMLRLLTRADIPELAQADNAYDSILDLSGAISNATVRDAAFTTNLERLRELLLKPSSVPLAYSMDDVATDDITAIRSTARAIVSQGESQFASREFDSASQSHMLTIEYGLKVRRGGLLLNMLVGVAATGSGIDPLYKCCQNCSRSSRSRVVDELLGLLESRESAQAFVQRDQLWSIHQGWHPHTQYLLNWVTGVSQSVVPISEEAMNLELARLRLLAAEFAIANYLEDHGTLPTELAALVPRYLPTVLEDPFSNKGEGLEYHVEGTRYRLYSLGSNRIDEGGTPPDHEADFQAGDILFQREAD